MKYVVTPKEMLEAENTAFASGLEPLKAMDTAGNHIYEFAKAFDRILVVAGAGNNGGDGFKAACELHNSGKSVDVLFVGDKSKLSAHALHFYEKAVSLITDEIKADYQLVIDALFGIGFKGTLKDDFLDAVRLINSFKEKAHILSVDIPSGLNGLTGEAENAVCADTTITFQAKKLGHIIGKGADFSGELIVKDIGIDLASAVLYPEPEDVELNKIAPTAHKGTQGHIGIIAGSLGMEGAALLASSAAIKTGAGKVSLAVDKNIISNFSHRAPEIMVTSRESTPDFIKDKSVVLFGCGIGRGADNKEILDTLINNCTCPLVIDADGLFFLTKEHLRNAKCPVILTPHMAEAARLFNTDIVTLLSAPIENCRKFHLETGATILLKSNYNLTVSFDGMFISQFGCKGMSTAGSGDVLAGLVAGAVNLQKNITEGVLLGAYLHGTAGRYAEKEKTEYAMTASDIINNIYNAFKEKAGK